MGSKIKSLVNDYKVLLRSVPALIIIAYTVSTIAMNLAASKVVFQIGNVAGTGGILLSWIPFLCMDTTVKRFEQGHQLCSISLQHSLIFLL